MIEEKYHCLAFLGHIGVFQVPGDRLQDQTSAKKSVQSNLEWSRLFSAWEAGVLILYSHHATELAAYSSQVNGLFRTFSNNPAIAIEFDAEVREDYSRNPFRMDDQNRTHLHMLSALSKVHIIPGGGESSTKHPLVLSSNPSCKKKRVICNNWNLGICTKPCPGNRILLSARKQNYARFR